ncbi:MAG: cyclodeaminase/cyclohydrolase family protein [Planctomycetes bacterium]|nr:cyclodeaminase/cyclohydrolase family protein [Planctomycetota bacterium]
MFRDLTLSQFSAAVSAKTPTPGGGSVSAVVASLGAALGAMVVQFSLDRAEHAPYEHELRVALRDLTRLGGELERLADDDAAAYDAYTAALRLPKDAPEQKEARKTAMQGALRRALEVPLTGMRTTGALLDRLRPLVGRTNPHLVSDLGVGALLAFAAHRGCRMNVEVNLASIKDAAYAAEVRAEADRLSADAARRHDEILELLGRKP